MRTLEGARLEENGVFYTRSLLLRFKDELVDINCGIKFKLEVPLEVGEEILPDRSYCSPSPSFSSTFADGFSSCFLSSLSLTIRVDFLYGQLLESDSLSWEDKIPPFEDMRPLATFCLDVSHCGSRLHALSPLLPSNLTSDPRNLSRKVSKSMDSVRY